MTADRILVPLDGSALAEDVLPQLGRLLKLSNAEVVLLHIYAVPPLEIDYVSLIPRLHDAARSYVAQVEATLVSQGLRARGLVREGRTAETILQVADEERASLIAMSTHGRSGPARWAFGSVAEKVLRASRVPVLVVRSLRKAPAGRPPELPFKKILIPADGSALGVEGIRLLARLLRPLDARVILLHVYEHPAPKEGPRMPLEESALVLSDAGIPASLDLRLGDAAEEILGAARDHEADLIAMSTHGRSGFSRWMLGSVTEKVLRAATLPMLIVRPARKEK